MKNRNLYIKTKSIVLLSPAQYSFQWLSSIDQVSSFQPSVLRQLPSPSRAASTRSSDLATRGQESPSPRPPAAGGLQANGEGPGGGSRHRRMEELGVQTWKPGEPSRPSPPVRTPGAAPGPQPRPAAPKEEARALHLLEEEGPGTCVLSPQPHLFKAGLPPRTGPRPPRSQKGPYWAARTPALAGDARTALNCQPPRSEWESREALPRPRAASRADKGWSPL